MWFALHLTPLLLVQVDITTAERSLSLLRRVSSGGMLSGECRPHCRLSRQLPSFDCSSSPRGDSVSLAAVWPSVNDDNTLPLWFQASSRRRQRRRTTMSRWMACLSALAPSRSASAPAASRPRRRQSIRRPHRGVAVPRRRQRCAHECLQHVRRAVR